MQDRDARLWGAFEDGGEVPLSNREPGIIEIVDAAPLVIPSGRLTACDLHEISQKPFRFEVERESYSVVLSMIDGEPALVMVTFEAGRPARFEPARPSNFTVDSARACFMDSGLQKRLQKRLDADRYGRDIERFESAMEENDGLWANVVVDRGTSANVIAFQTYGGDGGGSSYLGFDSDDRLLCLIVDLIGVGDDEPA